MLNTSYLIYLKIGLAWLLALKILVAPLITTKRFMLWPQKSYGTFVLVPVLAQAIALLAKWMAHLRVLSGIHWSGLAY